MGLNMVKKIYLSTLVTLICTTALGGAYSPDFTNQLNHIRTEMRAIKRAWNTARLRIKMAQKNTPVAYQSMQPAIEKLISSDAFTTKINAIVDEQVDAIANRNASFGSVKNELSASGLFPNITLNTFGQTLFAAMANKECYFLLGKKLALKMQELLAAIAANQQMLMSIPMPS